MLDERLQDLLPPLLENGQGSALVALHHATVANHVGGQDSREAALNAFFDRVMQAISEKCIGTGLRSPSGPPSVRLGSQANIRRTNGTECECLLWASNRHRASPRMKANRFE